MELKPMQDWDDLSRMALAGRIGLGLIRGKHEQAQMTLSGVRYETVFVVTANMLLALKQQNACREVRKPITRLSEVKRSRGQP
jgi:hypothetical protein